jgi:hypothetical protein
LYIQYAEPNSYVINKTIPNRSNRLYSTSVTIQQVLSLPQVQLLPTSLYHPHPADKKLTCSFKPTYFNKFRINLSECRGRYILFLYQLLINTNRPQQNSHDNARYPRLIGTVIKHLNNDLRTKALQKELSALGIVCVEGGRLRSLSFQDIENKFLSKNGKS